MDVAKYIGFFLLKNEQCYVSGLGTLQLIRKAASYDGEQLHAATQEIIMVPGGNVDESLANYIATNEQISITKASNALKEFSTETKTALQAGNTVTLPHLGKFTANDGRIGFITTPQLQYKAPSIAAKKGISLQQNERPPIPHQAFIPTTPVGAPKMPIGQDPSMPQAQPYMAQQPERKERLNWARIIFVLLLLIIMAGAAYYGYVRYMAPKAPATTRPVLTIPETVDDINTNMETTEEEIPVMEDSSAIVSEKNKTTPDVKPAVQEEKPKEKPKNITTANTEPVYTPPPVESTTPKNKVNVDIVLNTFDSKDEAYKRKRSLEARGNKVKVIEEDVDYFFVAMPISAPAKDTARIIDSLSRTFNPNGVFVY